MLIKIERLKFYLWTDRLEPPALVTSGGVSLARLNQTATKTTSMSPQ